MWRHRHGYSANRLECLSFVPLTRARARFACLFHSVCLILPLCLTLSLFRCVCVCVYVQACVRAFLFSSVCFSPPCTFLVGSSSFCYPASDNPCSCSSPLAPGRKDLFFPEVNAVSRFRCGAVGVGAAHSDGPSKAKATGRYNRKAIK